MADELSVLFFTIGPDCEPSSRFRVYQYLDALREHGIEGEVRPCVGRRYFELGYGLRRARAPVRAAWAAGSFGWRTLRRLRDLVAARRFDVVVLQKETLPFGMERLIPLLGLRAVYDFDDAVHLTPPGDGGLGPRVRAAAEWLQRRERALPALLARCRAVVAGSPALAEFARAHNENVTVLGTVVDTDAYPRRVARRDGRLTVGWVGAPAGSVYLEPLRPVFAELARRDDVRVLLLGAQGFECPGVEVRPFRIYRSRAEEAADLADLDVGLMPLPDEPFAAGKCALKAVQYMAAGIPVVASPVGAATEVVEDGVCGYLARTPEEWLERLTTLLDDPDLRQRMGRAGRARAERRHSLRAAAPRLAALLHSVARSAARDPRGGRPQTD